MKTTCYIYTLFGIQCKIHGMINYYKIFYYTIVATLN